MRVVPCRRWALIAVFASALGGCGTAQPSALSDNAKVLTSVKTYPASYADGDNYAEPTGATERMVVVQVRPHCIDGSHTLDCGGQYSLTWKYRYRKGKPESVRCGAAPTSMGFGTDDVMQAVPAIEPTIPGECHEAAPGELSVASSLPMADVRNGGPTNGDRPPAAFQVTMRITVDQTGALQYHWQSRNGAHCTGQIATTTPQQTTTCRWR